MQHYAKNTCNYTGMIEVNAIMRNRKTHSTLQISLKNNLCNYVKQILSIVEVLRCGLFDHYDGHHNVNAIMGKRKTHSTLQVSPTIT